MVVLVALVPFYIFIAELTRGRILHVPAVAFDQLVPLQPIWALVYGPLYLFLILLPVFVVRQNEQIRRTVFAYLTVWIVAYASATLLISKGWESSTTSIWKSTTPQPARAFLSCTSGK
jgi:hypothetical protein